MPLKLAPDAKKKYDEATKNPTKSGWLEKVGGKRKTINKRWFVLKENYIFYAKKQGQDPLGVLNVYGGKAMAVEGPTYRQFSFTVLAPKSVSEDAKWVNRSYLFTASSSDEVSGWVDAINKATTFEQSTKVEEEKSRPRTKTGGIDAPSSDEEDDK